MDDWLERVEVGQRSLSQTVFADIEWTVHLDDALGWVQMVHAFQRRERELKAALKAAGVTVRDAGSTGRQGTAGVSLTPMPPVRFGYKRGMPLLWGHLTEPERAAPPTFEEWLREMEADLKPALLKRWADYRAVELALAQLIEDFDGEDVTHVSLRESLDAWQAKLLELHGGLQDVVPPFELEEPTAEAAADMAGWLPARPRQVGARRRDDPREQRGRLSEQKRRELEEQEARWASEVRQPNVLP